MNGASNITWNENSPGDGEVAGLGDDNLRSLQTSMRQSLDDEHNWPSAGGANVGYHRLGSARPYYGTESRVSSSGSDGRLMLTSDTSRLFAVGSGGTVLLGSAQAISLGSFPDTTPQRHYWVEEFGTDVTGSSGSTVVTFPNSGYSGAPYIWLTPYSVSSSTNTVAKGVMIAADALVASSRTRVIVTTFVSVNTGPNGLEGVYVPANFVWRSLGTRVL